MMIDTHSHLFFEHYQDDLDDVMRRAKEGGVERVITISLDKPSAEENLRLVERFPGQVWCTVGVHPAEIANVTEEDLLWLEAMSGDPAVVAIGEIGLDIYRGETNLKEQEKLFERQLAHARHVGLPAVIHHRAAGLRTIEIIEAAGNTRGVFHCFSEDYDYAKRVLDQGFHISFTGNITYKNSHLPGLASRLPLERILLETDAPFMAPVPFRGKRAEPIHVKEVATKLAEIHHVSVQEVARTTTQSARSLFWTV
jgi:TatD DNase family protein